MGAAAGVAAGALAGVGSERLFERIDHEELSKSIPASLTQGTSALALLVEDRFAERLEEAFERLGKTVRKELKRVER